MALTKAGIIMDIYRLMEYTAMAVGPHDLPAGIEFLQQEMTDGIPWLSANILDEKGNPLLPPWKIVQAGELRVGLTALTSTESLKIDDVHIAPWQEVLPAIVDELEKKCDFIVLLSNLGKIQDSEIAAALTQLNLIIGADPKTGNKPPTLVNQSLLTQTQNKGKYLGSLKIHWNPEEPVWIPVQEASLPDKEGAPVISPKGSTFSSRFNTLSFAIPEDPVVRSIIDNKQ